MLRIIDPRSAEELKNETIYDWVSYWAIFWLYVIGVSRSLDSTTMEAILRLEDLETLEYWFFGTLRFLAGLFVGYLVGFFGIGAVLVFIGAFILPLFP